MTRCSAHFGELSGGASVAVGDMRSLRMLFAGAALTLATCGAPIDDADLGPSQDGLGALAGGSLVVDDARLVAFAADADNREIHALDLVGAHVTTTGVAGAPEQIVIAARDRIAVTLRDRNRVALFDVGSDDRLDIVREVEVPIDPYGLARAPDGTLLVTSAFGRRVTALDGATLAIRWSIEVAREPRGVAVAPDGSRAFVSHLVGASVSIVDLTAKNPTAYALPALGGAHRDRVDRALGAGTLHPTAALGYAVAISPSGTRAFVPHVVEQNGANIVRVVPGAYGGVPIEEDTSFASVAVLAIGATPVALAGDIRSRPAGLAATTPIAAEKGASGVSPSTSPARQARAVAVFENRLLLASQGTNELVELDARALDPALVPIRRVTVGEGPKGVAVAVSMRVAVVWNQLSHDFAIVGLDTGSVERIAAAKDPLPPAVAAGRRTFLTELDRAISRDGRACAGCHPEGRDDGVVWHLGAGPRQTPTLVGRVARGPFGWLGKHARLEDNIKETVGRLGGQGLGDARLKELATYLRDGLVAPTREPAPADERVARGKELFTSEKVGCAGCHRLENEASDRGVHDVASRAKNDQSAAFRTPPLLFVGDTAPYFHDGRYATLEQLLRDDLDRMGQTTQLSAAELDALAAYLRTL